MKKGKCNQENALYNAIKYKTTEILCLKIYTEMNKHTNILQNISILLFPISDLISIFKTAHNLLYHQLVQLEIDLLHDKDPCYDNTLQNRS